MITLFHQWERALTVDPPIDVASLFACYDDTLAQLVDKHTPLVKVVMRSRLTAPWYDASCRNAKANTRRLERFYRTSWTPAALAAWRMQSRYLRKFLQERHKEYWTDIVTANSRNSKILWSKVSRLLNEVPTVAATKRTSDDFAAHFEVKSIKFVSQHNLLHRL